MRPLYGGGKKKEKKTKLDGEWKQIRTGWYTTDKGKKEKGEGR
jgi:hypothetical protein